MDFIAYQTKIFKNVNLCNYHLKSPFASVSKKFHCIGTFDALKILALVQSFHLSQRILRRTYVDEFLESKSWVRTCDPDCAKTLQFHKAVSAFPSFS